MSTEAADKTLRQLTDAAQKLAGRSRPDGLISKFFLEKLLRHRTSGNPSPWRALRRLIAWSSPEPHLTVIAGKASFLSKRRRLAEAGLPGALSTDLSLFQSREDDPPRRRILIYDGKITDLVSLAATSTVCVNLIVLSSYSDFTDLLDAVLSIPERSSCSMKLPDIAVFTDDCTFFRRAWYHNRLAYEAFFAAATVCVTDHVCYFSCNQAELAAAGAAALENLVAAQDAFALGSLLAVQEGDQLRFLINGFHAAASRTASTIGIVRSLLSDMRAKARRRGNERLPSRFFVVAQGGDLVLHEARSVAYGKRRGDAPEVQLIPDPFFFDSGGYRVIRSVLVEGRLPDWRNREDVVFWRGSTTNRGVSPTGDAVVQLEQAPRVAMCLALRGQPKTDAAITGPWGFQFSHEAAQRQLVDAGVFRPAVPMLEHAGYRYLIDIDGVANAWSFYEKLLLGSCILKVCSPYEQWFYGRITEWQHFVPVREDLSDLIAKIAWCRAHEDQARMIAEAGQRFAVDHTYESGWRLARRALRDCVISF